MGIKGLGELLKEHCEPQTWGKDTERVPLSKASGHSFAIDFLNNFHPYVVSAYENHASRDRDVVPLHRDVMRTALRFFRRSTLEPLMRNGVTPVVVMDGDASRLKSETQKSRRRTTDKYAAQQVDAEIRLEQIKLERARQVEQAAGEEVDDFELGLRVEEDKAVQSEVQELNARVVTAIKGSVRISDDDKRFAREYLHALGVPVITADGEAEKLCAQLVKDGHCRAAVSNDTDLYVHGCPVVVNKIEGDAVRVVLLCNVLAQLALSYAQFVDLCVMCGTDYNPNVPNFGPKRCYELIRHYGSLDDMPDDASTDFICERYEARTGRAMARLGAYRKSLLRNEGEGKSWRDIRREFLEGATSVDARELQIDECDIDAAREMLGETAPLAAYAKHHEALINATERKAPFASIVAVGL